MIRFGFCVIRNNHKSHHFLDYGWFKKLLSHSKLYFKSTNLNFRAILNNLRLLRQSVITWLFFFLFLYNCPSCVKTKLERNRTWNAIFNVVGKWKTKLKLH